MSFAEATIARTDLEERRVTRWAQAQTTATRMLAAEQADLGTQPASTTEVIEMIRDYTSLNARREGALGCVNRELFKDPMFMGALVEIVMTQTISPEGGRDV